MRKLKYLIILLMVFTIFSCTDDFDENIGNTEVVHLETTNLTVRSLPEINDPLLSNQLPKSINQIKEIISKELSHFVDEHHQNNLFLDLDNILVSRNSDDTKSYTLAIIIPKKDNEKSTVDSYLTLNFDDKENLNNYLQFGFEQLLYFDAEGKVLSQSISNAKYGYYSPKPSNKPSKAPKAVICNYHWNGNPPSALVSYCGWYYGGTGPAPIHILAAMFPEWYIFINGQWVELDEPMAIIPLTNDFNDLYYLYSDNNTYPIYNLSFHPHFPQLINEITNYYNQVYVTQLGYSITNPYSQTYEENHIHKQAFLDSFLKWLYKMETQAPSHYNYLTNNPDVLYELFNFFADYNLNNPINEPLYLGQPWYVWQYSPNPDVKCINTGAEYLITSTNGLILMQQLGSGFISINQFRNALPDCN